jgi:hypothetical protein
MRKIPAALNAQFNALLVKNKIPQRFHNVTIQVFQKDFFNPAESGINPHQNLLLCVHAAQAPALHVIQPARHLPAMPLYGFTDVPELSACKCGCAISTQLQCMADGSRAQARPPAKPSEAGRHLFVIF